MYWRQFAKSEGAPGLATTSDMGVGLLDDGGQFALRVLQLLADVLGGVLVIEILARGFAGDPSVRHDHDAVRGGEQLRQLGGDDEHRLAARSEIPDERDDLGLRADVDA